MFSTVMGNIINDIYNIRVSRLNKMNAIDNYIMGKYKTEHQVIQWATNILASSEIELMRLNSSLKGKIGISTSVSNRYHYDILIICDADIILDYVNDDLVKIKLECVNVGYGEYSREQRVFDNAYVYLKKDAHFFKIFAEYNKVKIN